MADSYANADDAAVDDDDPMPRDDRAWPRGSLTASVALLVIVLAGGVLTTFDAATGGDMPPTVVAIALLLALAYGTTLSVRGMKHWIAGRPFPALLRFLQWASIAAAFVLLFFVNANIGWAVIAGILAGVLAVNIWGIRSARGNRARVDAAEAVLARREEARRRDLAEAPALPLREAPVGQVLRQVMIVERTRATAWASATAIVVAACLLLQAPGVLTLVLLAVGGAASIWVTRRLIGAALALRTFLNADTTPHRLFVVLLNDPAPRVMRPLLGTWSTPPATKGGRMPRPEHVYRCDEELDGLLSFQGSVEVHEAWVDAGRYNSSRPRWVAADAGIAVPHRRAWLGRWYMSRLLVGERPPPPEPLTLHQPHPGRERPADGTGTPVKAFLIALATRLAALAVLGLLFQLIS